MTPTGRLIVQGQVLGGLAAPGSAKWWAAIDRSHDGPCYLPLRPLGHSVLINNMHSTTSVGSLHYQQGGLTPVHHASAALPLGKHPRYEAPESVWTGWLISALAGNRTPVV
jgi:hypothetical protein